MSFSASKPASGREPNRALEINRQKINYHLRSSRRARLMRLAVYSGGAVVVTKPWFLSERTVEGFLRQRAAWIISKINLFKQFKDFPEAFDNLSARDNRAHFLKHKSAALKLVQEKTAEFNRHYHFKHGRITVRNQATRWGSCSQKGNLNFNYKLLFLAPGLADYIIAHELCHLGEFNHSKDFWALVAQTVPDYAAQRKELKKMKIRFC